MTSEPGFRLSQSGAQLTQADIDDFETSLGESLPVEYRSFLLKSNGGVPDPSWFPTNEGYDDDISHFLAINSANQAADMSAQREYYRRWIAPRFLPIAICGGGDVLCICLSGDDRGSIHYWNHELGWYDDEPSEKSLSRLADRLSDFLNTVAKSDSDFVAMTIMTDKPWWKFW